MSDNERKRASQPARLARLFPDHPLQAERLEFEFEGFARTLAELAWNPDNATPFTVVVRGGWGRGKTTLLRRAQWMLEKPGEVEPGSPEGVREVRTLWFNAWKYPDDDTILAGLLGAAIERLETGGKLDQLKLLVKSYGEGTLRALFAMAAPAPLRDVILEGVEDRYRPVHEKRAFHDTFRRLFNEVSRLLFEITPAFRNTGGLREDQLWTPQTQRRQVLAVFLDDLDRCRQERVVEVIEAINLFLDLPGVCFFLGIDWERLVAVLPETVRSQGNEFLEKVVQVAFDLPEVSPAGAEEYLAGLLHGTELEAILDGDGDGTSEDIRVLAQALDTRHPRHMKRFLNDLSMSLAVLRNTGKLGDGGDRLPEPAVVTWHLLAEILPTEKWREVRALPQNLMKFLREMERLEEMGSAAGEAEEDSESLEEWRRIRASGLPEHRLKTLRKLSRFQRHLLVYLATPPPVEVTPGERMTGSMDLLDLSSSAWVELPGRMFWMGTQKDASSAPGFDPEAEQDESPVRLVTVGPFFLTRHPVTNAEYAVFVWETEKEPPRHWVEGLIPQGKEKHPVVHVSWNDAAAFCYWLSQRFSEAKKRQMFRLPTEAEWELAARGVEGRKYPWGSAEPTEDLANFGKRIGDTTPVGSYPDGATPEGVQDLAGNVLEWCADWKGPYPTKNEIDPTGAETGSSRVIRGGSFFSLPGPLRSAYRGGFRPELRGGYVGFRVALSSSGAEGT